MGVITAGNGLCSMIIMVKELVDTVW